MLIKEAAGDAAEVVIAIVGDEDADDALRTALAKGADRGIRVWDDALAEADGVAVSRGLAKLGGREQPGLVFPGAPSAEFGSAGTRPGPAGPPGRPPAPGGGQPYFHPVSFLPIPAPTNLTNYQFRSFS